MAQNTILSAYYPKQYLKDLAAFRAGNRATDGVAPYDRHSFEICCTNAILAVPFVNRALFELFGMLEWTLMNLDRVFPDLPEHVPVIGTRKPLRPTDTELLGQAPRELRLDNAFNGEVNMRAYTPDEFRSCWRLVLGHVYEVVANRETALIFKPHNNRITLPGQTEVELGHVKEELLKVIPEPGEGFLEVLMQDAEFAFHHISSCSDFKRSRRYPFRAYVRAIK